MTFPITKKTAAHGELLRTGCWSTSSGTSMALCMISVHPSKLNTKTDTKASNMLSKWYLGQGQGSGSGGRGEG